MGFFETMKPRIILGLALVLIGLPANCFGATDTTQAQLERMARTCTHFSLKVIIRNQRLWSVGRDLDLEQVFLAVDLRVLSPEREALASLLKHPDPRVRTLALGALFEREDGRDLPLIATLVNDEGATFPDLFDSTSGEGGPRPMSELESPQTVGQVAKAMLRFWMVPEDMSSFVEKETFSDYWKRHADRDHYASWFAVKMKRATRQSVPIQPEYLPDIQRVLAEMKALPMPDRAWTQLYVLAPGGWNEFEKEDLVAQDEELIAMIKELSPESLLHFLQRQKISDDPDLLMDKDNPEFIRMSNFILRHADQLLRPEDSDALLACEYVEHDSGGINPAWPIGAALVQPARASEILHNALAHETRTYETAAGRLAGALWRIRGPAEMDFLVDWFYATLPTARAPMHQPVAFLWEVKAAARPDTKQLFAALVKDPRFGHTDWNTLQEILSIVNASRPTPLVKERNIYAAQPNSLPDNRMVLQAWRNLLRREYGLPEQPLPSPAPTPSSPSR
jgi:hypothetical protein